MPDCRQLVDNCSTGKVFSTLDLKAGFHNIRASKATQEHLGMVTQRGMYRWLVMEWGLTGAPGYFQFVVDCVLTDCEGVDAYIDDCGV